MDESHSTSFLSKQVRNMIVEIGKPHLKNYNNKCVFISHRFTFKWENIETILGLSEDFSIHDQQSLWFIDKIEKLWPTFIEAHSLHNQSPLSVVDMQDLYEWTSHPKEVEEYFKYYLSSDVSSTEAILFLTAVLERSLGNLFLLKGSNVPSLLRDLLSTPELEIILGKVPVVFLQILMGTPSAMNLRNITWHGFPRQDELYPHFVSTLFVVILSVGELLRKRNTVYITLSKRPQMHFSDVLPDTFLCVQEYYEEIVDFFFDSDIIPTSHLPYWKFALEHYKNKRYGRSLLILLPQIEHMLRCLYCRLNDCQEKILTAESVTLYTTLSEIMAQNITHEDGVTKENKVIHFLGECTIEMLQDLFVHPAGPRLRDKMSHGECDLNNIPEQLVNQLISVAVLIEMKSKKHLQNKTIKEEISLEEMKQKILFACKNYIPKFHPTSLLKIIISKCLSDLNRLSMFNGKNVNNEIDINSWRPELSSLIKQVHNNLQKIGSCSCIESVSAHVASFKIKTVFRHKSENELVNILRQIMGHVKQICDQVVQNMQEKYSLYTQHLLRSRQRETFHRMLCLVPELKDVLFCITCIVTLYLQSVNNVCSLLGKEFENLTKFCRTILQFVQNVVSLTKCDKNRWLDIQILAEKFCLTVLKKLDADFFMKFCNSCQ